MYDCTSLVHFKYNLNCLERRDKTYESKILLESYAWAEVTSVKKNGMSDVLPKALD